jgi:acyl-[acyl carrier protein]--UDP-N-acetylglucosamine O-acyltransferase
MELKRLYHELFLSDANLSDALAAARLKFTSPKCRVLLDFVAASKRGVCTAKGHLDTNDEGAAR